VNSPASEQDGPRSTFFADADLTPGGRLDLGDAAAQHARVRRLEEGEAVRLTTGRGLKGTGRIDRLTKGALTVVVGEVTSAKQPPRLALLLPVADRERMLWLAEKAVELAVSMWQPVMFKRSASVAPRGEGESFERKVRARMIGALEQSGGAWLPEMLPTLALEDALVRWNASDDNHFLLERGGAPLAAVRPAGAAVMIGPEGGIEPTERSLIVDRHGWVPSSLGDTTLRFETAAIVAVGLLRALMAANSQPGT
jgi:16S rRNA (uracil1498-N3)-methyltransferase